MLILRALRSRFWLHQGVFPFPCLEALVTCSLPGSCTYGPCTARTAARLKQSQLLKLAVWCFRWGFQPLGLVFRSRQNKYRILVACGFRIIVSLLFLGHLLMQAASFRRNTRITCNTGWRHGGRPVYGRLGSKPKDAVG